MQPGGKIYRDHIGCSEGRFFRERARLLSLQDNVLFAGKFAHLNILANDGTLQCCSVL